MSEWFKQSLLCALASALGVFLACILVNEYETWTPRFLLSAVVFVTTFLIHFLFLQKDKSKES